MKLRRVTIKDFKRFTDLTVQEIPCTCRLIMLAGPNGCGKSSLFDALYTWHLHTWRQSGYFWDTTYHRKSKVREQEGWTGNDIQVQFCDEIPEDPKERKKAFYFRSAYRNEPEFQLNQLKKSNELLEQIRFQRMIDNDAAVSQNYQRLASKAFSDAFENAPANKTFKEFREETIGRIRDSFLRLFPDVELNNLGDPLTNGTFRFTKGVSTGFLFKNLSGGEKAAFDLILDLVVARSEYDNTVFCIDEPESHMNTRLQAELLSVLFELIPENCQLILATHSIGMMRRAREIEKGSPGSVAFLDFGERDYDEEQIIVPTQPTRVFWENAYSVALDDLADLLAPNKVVICEGSPKTKKVSCNQGLDARCYDQIFQAEFPEIKFISTGSANDVITDRLMIAETLRQLVGGLEIIRLIDRDDRSKTEVENERNRGVRVLSRRNLESYLFDDKVLVALAKKEGQPEKSAELLNEKKLLLSQSKGANDNFKPIRGELYIACKKLLSLTGCGNTTEAFMRDTLAPLVQPSMETYCQLREDIFGDVE